MLQHKEPLDLILSVERVLVKDMARIAFEYCGIDFKQYSKFSDGPPFRPGPQQNLVGDCSLAERVIQFDPVEGIRDLIREIIAQAEKEEMV